MPKSLLLADDSVTIQKAVQMTFKAEDVTLIVVSDGSEALARAKAVRPDLILADVEMPGVGGYELCEKVRADAAIRHIPVLLLGGGTPVDPAKAIAVGANGHMAKPFDSQKLIDQVKQILANPKAVPVAAAASPGARPSAPAAAPARPSGISPVGGGTGAGQRPTPSRPVAPASRPPARPQPGVPASALTMARPPTSPGMKPVAPARGPPGGPRPAGPPGPRPPGAVPPGSRPPQPAAARAPMAPGSRPPAPGAVRPPQARPAVARPPPAKPIPPRPPQETMQRSAPAPGDEDLPMEVDEIVEESAVSAPPPLRPVPPPVGRQPSLSVVSGDGGEALLREALSKASREVIEKIAWEVVPELAETIIREELERLMKERGA
ncbi:MAG TPA: response regulator [Myxococcales bacterium]|nr:response regulator [Myxococcales bacterium]